MSQESITSTLTEETNSSLSEVATNSSLMEKSDSQNPRSWAELLEGLGKLKLKVGSIPLQQPPDLSPDLVDSQKSDDEYSKKRLTIAFIDDGDLEVISSAIEAYEKLLRSKTIIIEMSSILHNECEAKAELDVDLPILYVQPSEKLEVRTSICLFDEYKNECNVTRRICKELLPKNPDCKTVLLLFGTGEVGDELAQEVLKLAKTKLKPKTYNVLGSRCEEIIKDISKDYENPICFGLTLSSSDIKTWSFINTDCFITHSELHSDLLNFKESVQLGSKNLGLVVGPNELMNDEKIFGVENEDHLLRSDIYMKIIKDVFPSVTFIGAFNYDCDNIYTSSPNSDSCSDIFVCGKLISLLIISYD